MKNLSIVTAIHNQIAYNRLFLKYLKKHTYYPYDLIVINNVSTDGSADLFREHGALVIDNAENVSYSRAQNQGLALVKTPYTAFLNNDIVVSQHWDKDMIASIERYGLDALSSAGIENMECDSVTRRFSRRWQRINLLQRLRFRLGIGYSDASLEKMVTVMYGDWERFTAARRAAWRNFVYPGIQGNVIVTRTALFEKIGPWNEAVAGADWDLMLRLVKRQIEQGDTLRPMIAADVYIHHFVSATFRSKPAAQRTWNRLANVTDYYAAADLRYLHRPAASIVIAVYERPDMLEKIFLSLLNQSEKDFEIVVADDGSGPAVAECIARYNNRFTYPIQHVWQKNEGFRKTVIANRAVMRARSRYLIFIDGDCLLHPQFVARHILRGRVGWVHAGRRVKFNAALTKTLTDNDVASGRFVQPTFWQGRTEDGTAGYGRYRPALYGFKNFIHPVYEIIGCNFSLFLGDLLRVNGYDERVVGRGMEDNNLCNRLKRAPVRIGYISNEALQYHLHHDAKPIPHTPESIAEYGNPSYAWTPDGIVKGDAYA